MAVDISGTSTLTGGVYQKPTISDSGSEVFDILETFMERMAAHSHSGADSLGINVTLTKTSYEAAAEDTDWSGADANGNKYVDIAITSSSHYLMGGDGITATPTDITRDFYYLADNVDSTGDRGHVRFYPDIEWQGATGSSLRITTNIWETIQDASATAKVIMKVY